MREMVMGPARGEPPPAARPFVALMGAIGRNIRPRVVKIPRLSDRELKRLKIPMLVIIGGKDVLLDSSDTRRRMETSAPHAEVGFLPEARHLILGQSGKILQFLSSGVQQSQDVEKP